jgi:hypothetical protein
LPEIHALRGGAAVAEPPVLAPPRRAEERPLPRPLPRRGGRDVALDLVRGLGILILFINHIHLESPLESATRAVLSAAEVLVLVSGVVSGMVFGRRWRTAGARAATTALLQRARKLYVASVVVVGTVGALTLVPGLATDVLRFSPRTPGRDLYGFDGPLDAVIGILTLHAGPWQFNILGFFIAMLALTPLVLAALARDWWPGVLAASAGLYLLGRATGIDVLPSQSERPFALLVWQILFVPGIVLGWHRAQVGAFFARYRGTITGVVAAVALVAIYLRLYAKFGLDPLDLLAFDAAAFDLAHFHKGTLDPLRLATMVSVVAAVYLALRRVEPLAGRVLGPVLLPLGRNSFYVFIVHVFVCLAVASVPVLAGAGLGGLGNAVVQVGCLAGLVVMTRRGFLFRWIPR